MWGAQQSHKIRKDKQAVKHSRYDAHWYKPQSDKATPEQ